MSYWGVLEYNQASRRAEVLYGPFDELAEAQGEAESQALAAASYGRRERYTVVELVEHEEYGDE